MSIDLVIHFSYSPNFVNKGDCKKPSKYKVGHKTANLEQRIPVSVNRNRLDLKFKKMLTAQLNSVNHLLRHDRRAVIYVDGQLFHVTTKSNQDMANTLTNILIKSRKKITLDSVIK